MKMDKKGKGCFSKVTLNPMITVLEASMKEKANEYCFIANSVNFTIEHNPECIVKS